MNDANIAYENQLNTGMQYVSLILASYVLQMYVIGAYYRYKANEEKAAMHTCW